MSFPGELSRKAFQESFPEELSRRAFQKSFPEELSRRGFLESFPGEPPESLLQTFLLREIPNIFGKEYLFGVSRWGHL